MHRALYRYDKAVEERGGVGEVGRNQTEGGQAHKRAAGTSKLVRGVRPWLKQVKNMGGVTLAFNIIVDAHSTD